MMHEPERAKLFPPQVKTILMSQSDFQLPGKEMGAEMRDYAVPKKCDMRLPSLPIHPCQWAQCPGRKKGRRGMWAFSLVC